MKVGIITINDYSNYGNRLQNYAVQEVLKFLDCEVNTVVNHNRVRHKKPRRNFVETIEHMIEKNKGMSWDYAKLRLYKIINKKQLKQYQNCRREAFQLFTSQYIVETNYEISTGNIPEDISQKYDFFVTGSDQVWNPYYRSFSPIDFLTFAPKDKRIAYAPSFGVSAIPATHREDYRIWLSEMKSLSVREETGAKMIKELTGRNAVVLVDPTLMLSRDKWLSISRASALKPQNKYLLTYYLGKQAHGRKVSKQIAQEYNLEIVNLADLRDPKYFCIDPAEFIDLIHSAEVFLTDSFHGAAFSILLAKPFVIFDRIGAQSLSSRLDTLLSTFKLESRKLQFLKDSDSIFSIDFGHVPAILGKERNKAFNYLKEALGMGERHDKNN